MKRYRSYSMFQRALAALLCLSMVLSAVTGTDLPELLHFTETVNAEGTETSEYPDEETLLYRWENDKEYLSAARPLYSSVGNKFGDIVRKTIFHVYAFEGDTICIGSSVADSQIDMNFNVSTTKVNDKGSVDVVMTDLNGVKHPIDIRYKADTSAGEKEEGFVQTGFIENPGVELAALKMEKVGDKFIGTTDFTDSKGEKKEYTYTPYTYTVTETGVYTFEFHSYNKNGNTGIHIPRSDINMPSSANDHKYKGNNITGWIAALDLTVFNENGEKQHGRTYADCLALEMGPSSTYGVRDSYYILTTDSYIYKMTFNDATPYTYNFFANSSGIMSYENNEIVYTSVKSTTNTINFGNIGTYFRYPGTKDTAQSKSFYIFLEYPDDDLYGHLYERALQPDPAKNIRFVDTVDYEGKTVPGSYAGMGGWFEFDVGEATTATLRLEFKNVKEKAEAWKKENAAESVAEKFLSVPNALITGTKAETPTESEDPTESETPTETSEPVSETAAFVSEDATEEIPASSSGEALSDPASEEMAVSEWETDAAETSDTEAPASDPAETTEPKTVFENEKKVLATDTAPTENTEILEHYEPVEISGIVTPNARNRFYWDGCDGNGVPIPPGQYSIEDIVFTVTTKAGEIHFPIIDMENASGGITFTRLSHIYDKDGVQLDTKGSIYDLTKSVIYYDDTAIYYGEQLTPLGTSENQVTLALSTSNDPWKSLDDRYFTAVNNAVIEFFSNLKPEDAKRYWTYNNMRTIGGEYLARENSGGYITSPTDDSKIRVGDHSHTTNIIQYFDEAGNVLKEGDLLYESQKSMIKYLDSKDNPVGKSTGTGIGYNSGKKEEPDTYYYSSNVTYAQSTTDYGIANFWAFIPAKPEVATGTEQEITIIDSENVFNLIGRVFYDASNNGIFEESSTAGEYAIPDVKLNLYKQVEKTEVDFTKHSYVDENGEKLTALNTVGKVYELVASEKTTLSGNYIFRGLEYDPTNGTEYLYQVERPNESYELTTKAQPVTAAANFCKNYAYGTDYTGKELQIIKVGGAGGIDPTKRAMGSSQNPSLTVCAADVGYFYKPLDHSVTLMKSWKTTEKHPDTVVFELSYKLEGSNETKLYGYRTLSGGNSWQVKEEYLPSKLDEKTVDNYFVSAEYYIKDGKVYKQSYDFNTSLGKYESFVGKAQYAPIEALKIESGENFSSLSDLSVLNSYSEWQSCAEGATYKAVLDRDMRPDNTTITITNSKQLGTIEILKYVDSPEDDKNHLAGATFRIYEGDMATIKKYVEEKNNTKLTELQRGSGTTRSNGRIAFPGLDPTKTYTVRERYAPDGYRILEEFYEVKGKDKPTTTKDEIQFNEENYALLQVGNALADTDFKIRKRISGRAWQSDDEFTFTITPAFDDTELAADGKFVIDDKEDALYNNMGAGGTTVALSELAKFVESFDTQTITINNARPYYSYTSKNINGKDVTISSSDTKVSDPLLVMNGENAAFIKSDFVFPLVGTYTFTVNENALTGKNTLEIDLRTYTVNILVRRELNEKDAGDPTITLENSHLVAEVTKITYKDTTEGAEKVFAGSSPVFTNTYKPAPAEQDTTYKIVKKFTGRTWKQEDNFIIKIEGIGTETQNAIKDGQLTITGLNIDAVKKTDTGWTYTVPNPASGGETVELPFTSFKFNNIIFPVEYVNNKTGEVWNATEENPTPSEDQIGTGDGQYSPRTMPVTYWLSIGEDIPADASGNVKDGITYDKGMYYLQIILRNAEARVSNATEEEDGIIDEIEMKLYHVNEKVENVNELTDTNRVATCYTKAEVLTEDEWKKTPTINDGEKYTWFNVTKAGMLEKASTADNIPPIKTPDDYKLLVRRCEVHTDTAGTDGHTMTITNTYHTSFALSPIIQKMLSGRDWTTTDEFKFTIEWTDTDKPGLEMPSNNTVTITKDTPDNKGSFDAIKFTQPGEYHFTITEEDTQNHLKLCEYEITVKVTDNGKGYLIPTIEGFEESEINTKAIEFVNTYSDTAFKLNIAKTIEGREWNDTDEFKFKITPNDATKTAITNGTIEMPTDATSVDDYYTITLNKNSDPTKALTKPFGEITIKNTGTLTTGTQYQFTIKEETDELKEKNMYCREPEIDLYVTVEPKNTSGTTTSTNKLVATFAHVVSGEDPPTAPGATDKNVTIPFTNVAAGTLTVGKMVVSNAEEDKTEFDFEVTFTYDGTLKADADHDIKANKELTPAKTDNVWTYKFTLTDGESVVFSNIPPRTQYKITETIADKDKYILLRVCDENKDNGGDMRADGGGDSVNGTINPKSDGENNNPYCLFVNGFYQELPSGGGGGIEGYIFFGTALTVGAVMLLAVLYGKRRKKFQ